MSDKPTIVLIHGAFADAGSWAPVTQLLLDRGYTVRLPGLPLRDLLGDSIYIRSVVENIGGPVLLVGHSYAGAVITVAGTANNVVGLVYVNAFASEENETITQLQSGFGAPDLAAKIVATPFPIDGAAPGTDLSVDVDAFPMLMAEGVDPTAAKLFAVSQRPVAAIAFDQPAPVAAWKTKPAWGVVSMRDLAINPDVERFGYQRAGFRKVIELDASHLVMQTHASQVAGLIEEAASAVSANSMASSPA
jgi:pimeloyl-ACP methyl ester carboxylesterase